MFSFLYPLYMDFNQMILRATLHYILYLKCRSYSIKSLNLIVKVYNFNLLYTLNVGYRMFFHDRARGEAECEIMKKIIL